MVRKRPKLEPRYEINVSLKAWDIARAGAGVTFKIRDHDGLLGTIEIGQGTFGWKRARGKKGFKRIPWRQFSEAMERL
ncbi:MAG: hypothetical protein HYR63_03535 [Proteobacteria bacterium]|nr:hypothetical protein [Pseudomonadota bacterium]MBI3500024.1 hypothetical protein [Pseudomonadota bacterium]